jgi:hypothetical protein
VHFLRTNRHASAIITAVVLVVVGVVLGLTRHDPGDHGGVVLRADQQALQPSPTVTVPGDIVGRTPTVDQPSHPPLTLGNLNSPIHTPGPVHGGHSSGGDTNSGGDGGGDTTATTTGSHTTTTVVRSGAFVAGRIAYSASGTIWSVNPDGTEPGRLASPGYFPAWSPDHSAVAYSDSDNPGGTLYVATASDAYPVTTGVAKDSHPAWSPDAKQITFARIDLSQNQQSSEYSEIWAVNRDGTNVRQLTHLPCLSSDPSWSPDGKKIVFWSSTDHCSPGPGFGNYELYTINVDGSGLKRLGTTPNSGAPAWSPDGKTIAFSCDGYSGVGVEVCVMNADGTNAHRITNLSGDQTDPAWSPDGKSIAFINGGALWTMRADGSNGKQIAANGAAPAWY